MKPKIVFHPDTLMMEIDGKMYEPYRTTHKKVDGIEHDDKIFFRETTEEDKKKKGFIVNKLKDSIPIERVAEEIVKAMPLDKVNRVYNLLQNKNTKIKRQDGCLGIKIEGNKGKSSYIQIFE